MYCLIAVRPQRNRRQMAEMHINISKPSSQTVPITQSWLLRTFTLYLPRLSFPSLPPASLSWLRSLDSSFLLALLLVLGFSLHLCALSPLSSLSLFPLMTQFRMDHSRCFTVPHTYPQLNPPPQPYLGAVGSSCSSFSCLPLFGWTQCYLPDVRTDHEI